MPIPFDQARASINQLVKQFKTNLALYRAPTYKEASARQEFIDKMFVYLGWDIYNEEHAAPQYRDVEVEPTQDVEGEKKAPDYVFRIGKEKKFFVEAKKPGVAIKTDAKPAYQIRRYAWSAKLPLSLLTDFEELAVYDCRTRPSINDQAGVARINFFTFDQYPDRWREVWDVFSREAVRGGSFDQYIDQTKGKRGTATVDAEFLKEIEGWREALARNLALRNPKLSIDELNDAVQRTIDRIIFLRMTEDRGIEAQDRLKHAAERENIYAELLSLFQQADARYNSGLFDFNADQLTARLSIDDKVLKPIIADLYYPQPYEFSVMPAEILGNVYEQFLGKVIRLTAAHQAKVEEKPEVKKAGGVYYTPSYIVDYIVQHTVGQMIEGKTPRQLQSFRVLDMACGSGSFLLGAYQYLLDYYLKWYIDQLDPSGFKNPKGLVRVGDDWRLTTTERKRILLAHIFGVDIDRQAVEVTKLSLLLKVLEGENEQSLQMELIVKERALPNLDANIKCGNSLIGPDYFDDRPLGFFETPKVLDDEHRRVNPFDWQSEFPEAMKAGGFDCVIGNPPYIRIQTMKEWAPTEVEVYKQKYIAASSGNYDIYVVFVEKGLGLLSKSGRLGFILPHKFFNAQYGEPLRGLIAKGKHLSHVVHFGDQQVFAGATTYTCLMFLDKTSRSEFQFVSVNDLSMWRSSGKAIKGEVSASNVTDTEWNFTVGESAPLFDKLSKLPVKLADVSHLFVGLQTDGDDVYIVEEIRRDKGRVLCESKSTGKQHWFEDEHLKPFLKGSLNIRRYSLTDASKRLIFPYELKGDKSVLIEAKDYKRRYPLTWAYLEENKEVLAKRNKGQMGQEWYGYVYKKNHTRFNQPKLLVPSIATGSAFAADLSGKYYFVGSGGGGGGGYAITLLPETKFSPLYLLGLLNSSLLDFYIKRTSTPFRGGFLALNRQYIEQLPICPIDFTKPQDKARHDRMVSLVEKMLALHQQLPSAKTAADRDLIQRQIDATDRSIDALVASRELYGLTKEEIKIVEGE